MIHQENSLNNELFSTGYRLGAYSTENVPQRERIEYWQELIADRLVPLSFRIANSDGLKASLQWTQIGDIQISEIVATPHVATRTTANIRHAGEDFLVVNFLRAGACTVEQNNNNSLISACKNTKHSAFFCDAARPYEISIHEPFSLISMQIPRAKIEHSLSGLNRIVAKEFLSNSTVYPIVTSYIGHLLSMPTTLAPDIGMKLADNFTDLLATSIAEMLNGENAVISDGKVALILRIKAYINDHLHDTELSPQKVSDALNVSTRYINQLLSSDGTSLSRYIWKCRLEKVAKLLQTPSNCKNNISTYAFSCGFNDIAHFSKVFKKHYDMTPTEYRAYYLNRNSANGQ
ncbi:hypothetical protein DN730_05535 [Marinomonas piezotolerans]|uniref:HTH araC/xylS-type domain-containing protein n=1 Tax=Marinomonas piezotolerans TaxID=2213058 RepID=A0A370UBE9_9GAMM|nr:helix-turn-helix domain-containing protein [Marinomonas piezotolerans]RDL45079.1 hypothetical protein DN730_05535 [Marinomonas piezotolerans]